MKRPAAAKLAPIKQRCATVKSAIEDSECHERVKEMLCTTLNVTIGKNKADRHPFNERFVAMIEEVMKAEHARLVEEETKLDAEFKKLSPTKATREEAATSAKATADAKEQELEAAKSALKEKTAACKDADAALATKRNEQSEGDKGLEVAEATKANLVDTQQDALKSLIEDSVVDDEKKKRVQAVMDVGRKFHFDGSLMSTAAKVFEKAASERGGFDATCIEQLQSSFAASIAKLDEEIAAGSPAKAARAEAVAQAEATLKDAEAAKVAAEAALEAAQEANNTALDAHTAAEKSLADFMPELKEAGDNLDEAKDYVKSFVEAMQAFTELKEMKEGDFDPPPEKTTTIDGMSLDRAIMDACRTAVAGAGDGRVSVEDAKTVFEKIADDNKETQAERWTLRYCMQEFKWTEAAHDWIVEELKKVPQEGAAAESPSKRAKTDGAGYYETIDGFKCDRAIIDACREAMGGQGDGRVSVEDAHKVWAKAADGNQVTNAEKWTLRYCLASFKWTRAAHDWMMEEFHKEAAK